MITGNKNLTRHLESATQTLNLNLNIFLIKIFEKKGNKKLFTRPLKKSNINTGRLLSRLVLIILGDFAAMSDASFLTNLRVFQCCGARVGKMLEFHWPSVFEFAYRKTG
jgi:hypothetical protein